MNGMKIHGTEYSKGDRIECDGQPLELEGVLGQGGTATMYKAKTEEGEPRALKVLLGRDLGRMQLAAASIQKAMEVARGIEGSQTVLQGFRSQRIVAGMLQYEYVEGETLRSLSLYEDCPEKRLALVRKLVGECLYGWAQLKENDVLHGDLHPGNMMLEHGTGRVRFLDPDFLNRCSSKAPRGVLWFTAPEVIQGKPHPLSDLHAVGATLFGMFAGVCQKVQAFRRMTLEERLGGHLLESPTVQTHFDGFLRELDRRDPNLSELLWGLTEFDPENRPRSAEECLDLLD